MHSAPEEQEKSNDTKIQGESQNIGRTGTSRSRATITLTEKNKDTGGRSWDTRDPPAVTLKSSDSAYTPVARHKPPWGVLSQRIMTGHPIEHKRTRTLRMHVFFTYFLREAAKSYFLMTGPLRGGRGKGPAIKEKIAFFENVFFFYLSPL